MTTLTPAPSPAAAAATPGGAAMRWYDDPEVDAILAEPFFYPDDEPQTDAQQLDDYLAYQARSDPHYASDGVTD